MALIKCEECGREISSTAEKCPYCGYSTQYGHDAVEKKHCALYATVGTTELFIGVFMVLLNFSEFVDKFPDIAEYYKYFSDESKTAIWIFIIGVLLLIHGISNLANMVSKVSKMQEREIDEYMAKQRKTEKYNNNKNEKKE